MNVNNVEDEMTVDESIQVFEDFMKDSNSDPDLKRFYQMKFKELFNE